MKAINIVDVVLGKFQSEPLIEGVYTTNDPKDIRNTLVKTNLKVAQEVGKEVTHRDPHSPLYNGVKL